MDPSIFKTPKEINAPIEIRRVLREFLMPRYSYFNVQIKGMHKYYLENGGIIQDKSLYLKIIHTVFVYMIRSIFYNAAKIEFPFFATVHLRERTSPGLRYKRKKHVKGKNRYEFVFRGFKHQNFFLKTYNLFYQNLCGNKMICVNGERIINFVKYPPNGFPSRVNMVRRKNPYIIFKKEVKKT